MKLEMMETPIMTEWEQKERKGYIIRRWVFIEE